MNKDTFFAESKKEAHRFKQECQLRASLHESGVPIKLYGPVRQLSLEEVKDAFEFCGEVVDAGFDVYF